MKRMTHRDAIAAQRALNQLLREIGRSLAVQAAEAMQQSDQLARKAQDMQRASDALQSR